MYLHFTQNGRNSFTTCYFRRDSRAWCNVCRAGPVPADDYGSADYSYGDTVPLITRILIMVPQTYRLL